MHVVESSVKLKKKKKNLGVLVRIFSHFPSFYPTLLPKSEIVESESYYVCVV